MLLLCKLNGLRVRKIPACPKIYRISLHMPISVLVQSIWVSGCSSIKNDDLFFSIGMVEFKALNYWTIRPRQVVEMENAPQWRLLISDQHPKLCVVSEL